ncbi:glycosyltransferase family 2 protein [Parvularcula maris]|uniref:Glycosyltransferase family 2 protein n=1 Tax=Parvularcula maris TaxID=2965077 RepID=A0A9X2RIR2_9PROT|nr:glycosyltransferase family 2 protein [Parvularcula maris]MCQ8183843.1 glycosyltransferase family 2 protein [Parvularcula maris]
MRSVTVIIVNYRAAELIPPTLKRLSAVRQNGSYGVDVVIVDNASADGSVELLRHAVQELGAEGWVELLPAERNTGFAGGNNEGLRAVYTREEQPDAVFFLNPDTLLEMDCLEKLADTLFAEESIGIVGARIENETGDERASTFAFPSLVGELTTSLPMVSYLGSASTYKRPSIGKLAYEVEWVSGAAFMVRREALTDVAFMDDRFFLYFEEIDFQLAIRKAGWTILHNPAARCMHYAGVSTGVRGGRAVDKPMPRYWYESWRHYFVSNHGRPYAVGAAAAKLAGLMVRYVVQALRREDRKGRVGMIPFARHCLIGAVSEPAPERNNP